MWECPLQGENVEPPRSWVRCSLTSRIQVGQELSSCPLLGFLKVDASKKSLKITHAVFIQPILFVQNPPPSFLHFRKLFLKTLFPDSDMIEREIRLDGKKRKIIAGNLTVKTVGVIWFGKNYNRRISGTKSTHDSRNSKRIRMSIVKLSPKN